MLRNTHAHTHTHTLLSDYVLHFCSFFTSKTFLDNHLVHLTKKINDWKVDRIFLGASVAQTVKNLPAIQETWGFIPGSGRSPGEGNGYPL